MNEIHKIINIIAVCLIIFALIFIHVVGFKLFVTIYANDSAEFVHHPIHKLGDGEFFVASAVILIISLIMNILLYIKNKKLMKIAEDVEQ